MVMIIAGLILFVMESLFLVYLVRKQRNLIIREKTIVEREISAKRERKSLDNFKTILEENFIWELEERKNQILKEFSDKLYSYHLSPENYKALILDSEPHENLINDRLTKNQLA